MWHALDGVILHHVNLATRRPGLSAAQRPDSRPGTATSGNTGTHLHPAIQERALARRSEAGRGVADGGALLPPAAAVGVIGRIGPLFTARLNDEQPVLLPRIVLLIPLCRLTFLS